MFYNICNAQIYKIMRKSLRYPSPSNNIASIAGAVCVDYGNATVESCVFTDNYSYGYAGAIYIGADITVRNSTFLGNFAKVNV